MIMGIFGRSNVHTKSLKMAVKRRLWPKVFHGACSRRGVGDVAKSVAARERSVGASCAGGGGVCIGVLVQRAGQPVSSAEVGGALRAGNTYTRVLGRQDGPRQRPGLLGRRGRWPWRPGPSW